MKKLQKKDSLPYSGEINFNDIDVKSNLRQKKQIKAWIQNCIIKEGMELGEISYNFCSDEELLKTNITYLNHDFYTDIITFELNENNVVIGDVYISIDRVKENAKLMHVPLSIELKRVLIHGVLHLCGYKDKSRKQQEMMRQKEDYYLSLLP